MGLIYELQMNGTSAIRTSPAESPNAKKIPISRVRCVTETSVKFNIPIYPKNSDPPSATPSCAVERLQTITKKLGTE